MNKKKVRPARHVRALKRFNAPKNLEPVSAVPARHSRATFPIVGIGASAGGLEAMTQLLKHLPPRTGMAFALVQHLDPTHESALTSLLSRLTAMPVTEAKSNLPLLPDHLYIIPPNKVLGMRGRRLKLSPRNDSKIQQPIDEFFRSLASEAGNRAIGVLLSGNGSDGTEGLRAVKFAGGITFAQDAKSSKYPAMPANAINAGCVDFVLPPERLARELARIAGHPYVGPGPAAEEEEEHEPPGGGTPFEEVLAILRRHVGVDFTHYKHATLKRRMMRRLALQKFESLEKYVAYLRTHPLEVNELFNDILINVTGFFRDPGMFKALKTRYFPRLIRGKPADETIRVWVAGCSTGEEAYSLAIVLMEFLGEHNLRNPVQIFGTCIDEHALDKARAGIYSDHIKSDVSDERLRRFFIRTGDRYRIINSIRGLCVFARQNLAEDPPFSNLDLISCRNVLIYLGLPLQRKVLPLFHYALKPSGLLILGSSETAGASGQLFQFLDKKAKIFGRKNGAVRPPFFFAQGAARARSDINPQPAPPPAPSPSAGTSLTDVQKYADRVLLTQFSPAGVVINRHMEVQQFRGDTAPFLERAHGEASLNLLKLARGGLLPVLRSAVTRAIKQNVRVRRAGGRIREDGRNVAVFLEVVPFSVPPAHENYYFVLFQPADAGGRVAGRSRVHAPDEEARHARLAEELAVTRESLQAIVQEQEGTNEELRSVNEEITSNNEELQSTNEELETAKEELQSTNEELTTVNDELECRNTELEHANNDLHNILGSVNIPILILGADLRIRRLTGQAEKFLNLIPGDVGRPITDFNLPLEIPDLPRLVREVIDNLTTRELDVKDGKGHWWSLRVRPYKTTDNKIDGAVLALVDIDLIRTSAEFLSQGRTFLDAVINTVHRPVLVLDQDLAVLAANQVFYREFHVKPEETLNQRVYSLGNGQWDIPKLRTLLEEVLPHNSNFTDFAVEHDFPHIGTKRMVLDARRIAFRGDKQHLILLTIQELFGN